MDLLGEGSLDRALEKIGIVEAFEDSLGAFIQTLALLLKLAQNLESRLESSCLPAGCVEDGLGALALILRVFMVGHRRGGFHLGVLERKMCGVRAAFQIFEVG